ncbi:hypothetical protein EGJ52_21240 [Pseudomonas luteola]|uniref:hypothetical protein n=1 Tax=Pseudomonas luteola TaxID=47886 RepID=UPI000F7A39C3|nr:hypothetical protein [Pseudomonas luteola]RRW40497.1 hypothetical protein EGJ52_21240 [Pseudomonas luteola]
MDAIDEHQLFDFARNGAISHMTMQEMEPGRYCLVVALTWRTTGECVLYNARKSPRTWANLNTLADYIRRLEGPRAPIILELYLAEEEG